MVGIGIQERYEDIAKRSGLSEEIIRRVLKASRESLAESLTYGDRATLPGICTLIPEVKTRLDIGGSSIKSFIKVKSTPSNSLQTEVEKLAGFKETAITDVNINQDYEEMGIEALTFANPETRSIGDNIKGVRTRQISALL